MKKLKIVFLIAGFDGGGAQKQCIYLLNELQKDELLDIHLIYFYEGVNFYLLNDKNLSLNKVPTQSFYDIRNIFRISKIIKLIQPSILISWLHASDVYSFFIKKFHPNLKWIMTERDSSYPFDLRYKLRAFTGKRSDLIITNSYKGQEYWVKMGYPIQKIRVATNILIELSSKFEKKQNKNKTIIYVGRLEPQKNVITLTNFFIELTHLYPSTEFYIIGDGNLKTEIENLIEKNNKENSIHLLPFQKDISEFYEKADIFVNISFHEGTPNTVIENIQLDNYLITSNIPEHTDLLGNNYPFLLNNLNDSDEFKKLIEQIFKRLDRLESTEEILSVAKEKIKTMTPEIVSNQYINIFKSLQNDKTINI